MHDVSESDREFVARFEACHVAPADFDHRGHVRLAYIYLVTYDVDGAAAAMRAALVRFLQHNGMEVTRYHETLTRAWILAVRHFMASAGASASADEFIASNPDLLDSRIMLTHYSAEVLFSETARTVFVEPDVDQIPRYES